MEDELAWEDSDEPLRELRAELLLELAKAARRRPSDLPQELLIAVGLATHKAFCAGFKFAHAAQTIPIPASYVAALLHESAQPAPSSQSGYHARPDEVTVIRPPPKPAPGQRRVR